MNFVTLFQILQSMGKLKPPKEMTTNAWGDAIFQDVLAQAVRFAVNEHCMDKCVSHANLDSLIKERMGWNLLWQIEKGFIHLDNPKN